MRRLPAPAALLPQGNSQVEERFGKRRLDGNRFVVLGNGLRQLSLLIQRIAQPVVHLRSSPKCSAGRASRASLLRQQEICQSVAAARPAKIAAAPAPHIQRR